RGRPGAHAVPRVRRGVRAAVPARPPRLADHRPGDRPRAARHPAGPPRSPGAPGGWAVRAARGLPRRAGRAGAGEQARRARRRPVVGRRAARARAGRAPGPRVITVEVFATGRALTPDQERDLADHVLQALTTGESRSGCTRVAP